jgi:hypothetical protein
VKNSIKKLLKNNITKHKKSRKEEIKLNKIKRLEGEYMEFKDENLKEIVERKQAELEDTIKNAESEFVLKVGEKEEKQKKKEEKQKKNEEKQREKEKTRKLREQEKQKKKEEKEKK